MRGKTEEAHKLCEKIARINGKDVFDEDLYLEENQEDVQRLGDIRDLFGSRNMIKKTLITWYCW